MLYPHVSDRAKLVVGLLSADAALFSKLKKILERMFGNSDFESDISEFPYTDYYREEMGENLKRRFLSFDKLFRINGLHKIKLKTNGLEKRFSKNGKRAINIDPGYLNLSKLVLFSTKDYSHRIYLNNGILAEVTLYYKNNTFNPWPWTYPDYKSDTYIGIFNSIRSRYKNQIDRGSAL
ncbi:MAG: DUF4416 family protein [Candidatus Omnitrophota bacterium]|nr:DUF4416 family protein [Candidatus Omnitrophota bacterium]